MTPPAERVRPTENLVPGRKSVTIVDAPDGTRKLTVGRSGTWSEAANTAARTRPAPAITHPSAPPLAARVDTEGVPAPEAVNTVSARCSVRCRRATPPAVRAGRRSWRAGRATAGSSVPPEHGVWRAFGSRPADVGGHSRMRSGRPSRTPGAPAGLPRPAARTVCSEPDRRFERLGKQRLAGVARVHAAGKARLGRVHREQRSLTGV